jgi:hypothetical protein
MKKSETGMVEAVAKVINRATSPLPHCLSQDNVRVARGKSKEANRETYPYTRTKVGSYRYDPRATRDAAPSRPPVWGNDQQLHANPQQGDRNKDLSIKQPKQRRHGGRGRVERSSPSINQTAREQRVSRSRAKPQVRPRSAARVIPKHMSQGRPQVVQASRPRPMSAVAGCRTAAGSGRKAVQATRVNERLETRISNFEFRN